MCKEGEKIPDNHECCIITIKSSGTQIFLSDYVKANTLSMERGVLEFHYLHTYSGPAPDNGWMENVRMRGGSDMSFDALIKKRCEGLLPHDIQRMRFSELPEEIKELFRKFEPWAKLNISSVKDVIAFNIC